MTEKDQLFQERVNRFVTTTNHQEPDRVPILSLVETWAVSYANATINDCLQSHETEFEIFSKAFRDIYFDGTLGYGINRAMKVYQPLGVNSYFISDDGSTLQHSEVALMREDEYDQFLENPMSYTYNTLFPRKYPNLSKPYPENKEALKAAALEFAAFGQKMEGGAIYAKEKLGLPVTASGYVISPMDIMFDYYRGFVGTMTDMRRQPEKLKAAIESFVDFTIGLATRGAEKMDPFPWVFTPLHIPTFLGPKKFGEFYWPSYKKLLLALHERGVKVFAYLEGNWENYYEFLQELPKSFFIGNFEDDDVFKAKKLLGDRITISGGMTLNKLKYGTKQECIDYAKKLVDHCAPGGGYIFSTDLVLLSKGDVNVENLIAVNDFVHEYGVYK